MHRIMDSNQRLTANNLQKCGHHHISCTLCWLLTHFKRHHHTTANTRYNRFHLEQSWYYIISYFTIYSRTFYLFKQTHKQGVRRTKQMGQQMDGWWGKRMKGIENKRVCVCVCWWWCVQYSSILFYSHLRIYPFALANWIPEDMCTSCFPYWQKLLQQTNNIQLESRPHCQGKTSKTSNLFIQYLSYRWLTDEWEPSLTKPIHILFRTICACTCDT